MNARLERLQRYHDCLAAAVQQGAALPCEAYAATLPLSGPPGDTSDDFPARRQATTLADRLRRRGSAVTF